ncbi:hypothetical protein RRG08_060020 [Elysia crispata]|uniref:Uncharacterized protein n=1 Tax=Elysia crispata TaxID=231223 RepID=A0AAE0YES1_9GAST|nr:hypothetical protein RRG08_060020 [Elysia crispata]
MGQSASHSGPLSEERRAGETELSSQSCLPSSSLPGILVITTSVDLGSFCFLNFKCPSNVMCPVEPGHTATRYTEEFTFCVGLGGRTARATTHFHLDARSPVNREWLKYCEQREGNRLVRQAGRDLQLISPAEMKLTNVARPGPGGRPTAQLTLTGNCSTCTLSRTFGVNIEQPNQYPVVRLSVEENTQSADLTVALKSDVALSSDLVWVKKEATTDLDQTLVKTLGNSASGPGLQVFRLWLEPGALGLSPPGLLNESYSRSWLDIHCVCVLTRMVAFAEPCRRIQDPESDVFNRLPSRPAQLEAVSEYTSQGRSQNAHRKFGTEAARRGGWFGAYFSGSRVRCGAVRFFQIFIEVFDFSAVMGD